MLMILIEPPPPPPSPFAAIVPVLMAPLATREMSPPGLTPVAALEVTAPVVIEFAAKTWIACPFVVKLEVCIPAVVIAASEFIPKLPDTAPVVVLIVIELPIAIGSAVPMVMLPPPPPAFKGFVLKAFDRVTLFPAGLPCAIAIKLPLEPVPLPPTIGALFTEMTPAVPNAAS